MTRPGSVRETLRLELGFAWWLRGRPEIVEQWIAWSEDKRTSGGYYLEGMPTGRWRIGLCRQRQ